MEKRHLPSTLATWWQGFLELVELELVVRQDQAGVKSRVAQKPHHLFRSLKQACRLVKSNLVGSLAILKTSRVYSYAVRGHLWKRHSSRLAV